MRKAINVYNSTCKSRTLGQIFIVQFFKNFVEHRYFF